MVMADRPEVETASGPLTALAVAGLASSMLGGLARVPFKKPWSGPSGLLDNVGQSVTRQSIRTFMGYSMGLPIEEFRSMEKILDDICRVVMPPFVELTDGVELTDDTIGGVPGLWCRAKASTDAYVDEDEEKQEIGATILYLHGGGYIGTSPIMYSAFASSLVRITGFEVFIADYRMAPEFPFPAGVLDAADVYQALLGRGVTPEHIIVAGDSGGGGLAASLVAHLHEQGLPKPGAMALFSPEIDLDLDHPSITENAQYDVLPWNIPVTPYLHGVQPNDARVSIIHADPEPDWFPPTFVCWGKDEMFRDGIREFAARLEDSEVPTRALEEPGMFHVFPILMPWAEASKRVFRELQELAQGHVASDPDATQTH
ncbi:alpha/beta hydrolase [Gordonia alkanivorans]|uniref:alpha/beta hydrolase n=1 Tax=Gordonia alkanivorans TaxID=84096 RepID=UPI001F4F0573|nr:alpha/beta hydrolase [Gordonia alkanivorans]MDH3018393.1 alpha/beta hydrolase [Gordonia alkanivorans]MDH3023601.1 alpha/beta hydrolase [Gordonia alkanivorans]MDJ0008994.1 alpha/beta hydrolase [Gordonia alkanivorans]MDJ0098063.1 alpha/beta hydrolase [Gordonia alkanivorans]MDJ0494569.1 alpha/beta hydrolase [Gordonia alkanivorans]